MELLLECGHQAEVWIGKSTLCRSESVCPLWKIGDAVLTSYSRVVLQCNRTRRMMVGPLRVFLDSSIFPLILSIGPDHSQWLHGHHSKEIKVYLSSIKKLQTYPPPSDIPPPPRRQSTDPLFYRVDCQSFLGLHAYGAGWSDPQWRQKETL